MWRVVERAISESGVLYNPMILTHRGREKDRIPHMIHVEDEGKIAVEYRRI